MSLSVFDIFRVGIGPSSSHTVGPMRAARFFVERLEATGRLEHVASVDVELFGSLGLTGKAHGTDRGVILGLEGHRPEDVSPDEIPARLDSVRATGSIRLLDRHEIAFRESEHVVFNQRETLPVHSNGMRFRAADADGNEVHRYVAYSIGGGFVISEDEAARQEISSAPIDVPYPITSGDELLDLSRVHGLSLSAMVLENERQRRDEGDIRRGLLHLWRVMQACVTRGCRTEGVLPGGLDVRRRAPSLYRALLRRTDGDTLDPLTAMDWVNVWAIAVNEENAAGGRVVTAPTNGAAGIIPAVLHYYHEWYPGASDDGVVRFLLAAGAIGILYKLNASISGAEVGCQGEVGVACSMAAAGLVEAMGGSPAQVEEAAEIGMEHNLGLTCDPVAGLVQIPCIERNAMGAIKAINAARLALKSEGTHKVSLDEVIKTMRETGADMQSKYKESAQGGLAVNVVEC